jgi:phosphate transport system substrate-binding protein
MRRIPAMLRFPGVLAVLALCLAVAGCGGGDGGNGDGGASGRVQADGSSTVGPFVTAAAERFQGENPDVQVTVGVSGTGGGFERFCRGETDISNASRPIDDDEKEICERNGIEHVELQVANDALTVVVNRENDWATCLTVAQLEAIWEPGSTIDNWNEVPNANFPDEELRLYGPGTDSGTFDYFTDVIVGEEGASRPDFTASENDNVLVRGVIGERTALGYFGFSYYDESQAQLKALEVDGGNGCVAPSIETAQSGEYKPLSRPLFVYVKREALDRPAVRQFAEFMLEDAIEIAEASQFVPLTEEQRAQAEQKLSEAAGA